MLYIRQRSLEDVLAMLRRKNPPFAPPKLYYVYRHTKNPKLTGYCAEKPQHETFQDMGFALACEILVKGRLRNHLKLVG